MTIRVFCCFYNEAPLIPFFLRHYAYADGITAFVSRSVDDTRALLAADPRVTIIDAEMPDGIDDDLKIAWLNAAIATPTAEDTWYLVVDADEFIFPPGDPTGASARAYLASVPPHDGVLTAKLANVYRHADDADLDPAFAPVVLQRRHGTSQGQKPIVLRANRGYQLLPGNHYIVGMPAPSTTHAFDGAHWANADPSFAVTRRIRDRKERISQANRAKGHGWHHYKPTADDIAAELAAHLHDGAIL